MDIRHLVTVLHGWGFGAVFVLGSALAVVALTGSTARGEEAPSHREQVLLARSLWVLAATGWITVLLGAYVIYPW